MEMMFYVLFAFCLFFKLRNRIPILAALITSLYVVGIMADPFDNPASFYGDLKVFHFLAGVILAAYLTPHLTFSPWKAVAVLALSLIAIFGIEYSISARSALLVVPAVLVVASCVNLERVTPIPRWAWLETLGDASYSIYLTHVLAIAGLRIGMKLGGIGLTEWTAAAFVPVSILFSALLGVVVHRTVEKPLIRSANLILGARKPTPGGAMLR
jgi:exopolysaccharide production protein ExoZ